MKNKATKDKTSVKKPKSILKFFLITLGILVVLVLAIFFSLIISDAYTFTHPEKVSAKRFPDDSDIGLYYESSAISFEDNSQTVLWYIPAQDTKTAERNDSNITVIFSHDVGDNKTISKIDDGILYAKQLVGAGINVVTFDYSGSGYATGTAYTYGVREKEELCQIISYVKKEYKSDYIVLQGWGFGAVAAILAGVNNADVSAVISDASYSDAEQYFIKDNGFEKWSSMPSWTDNLTELFIKIFSENDIFSLSPLKAISEKNDKAWFFIGEENDNIFSSDYANELNNAAVAAGNNSRVWISENSYHAQAYRNNENNYIEKILEFIKENCNR